MHQALDIQSEQALELNKIIDYLKSFLFKEIIRLTFVNEMNTYYLNEKITDFYTQFIQLDMPQPTWHNIEDSLEAIKKICAKKRHYFHLTGSSNSLTTYQQFLEPLKKSLKELLLSEWEILDSIKERECFSTCHLGLKSSPFD